MSPQLKRVWRRHVSVMGIAMTAALILLVGLVVRLSATNDENHIEEVMAGANGNSRIQFIVMREEGGGNCWGPQGTEAQSRTMMVFFDSSGREIGKFKFPNNPKNTASNVCSIGNAPVLLATQEFANLPGAPTPDFIIPPLLNPLAGKVCFTNNVSPFTRNDCLSYGAFTGVTGTSEGGFVFGPPAAPLPIMNTVSLRRPNSATSFGSTKNTTFVITPTPTPRNSNGATFTIPVAPLRVQGENVFTLETFGGNGRTCATCHVASQNFGMTPANVQSRFVTVGTTFDPLFIGELKPSAFDAGFDFNLNTLDLTPTGVASKTPCPGDLRGIITTPNGGRANVLTRVSSTRYLVQGGANPPLAGEVSDTHACSATVSSLTAGDLAKPELPSVFGLEFPRLMRTSSDPTFLLGRALVLENVDGTGPPLSPHVFRKSPHLLNLSRTAPFGFSGDVPNLQAFLQGAINQHYPRSMARNPTGANPDFRLPTVDELRAAEAFMLAQEFPAGNDPNKFDLDRFATTSAQRSGRSLFFGSAKCSQCHGGPVLAATTASIQGKAIGINAAFNTGVVNQLINTAGGDNLPAEQGGEREFSVPQLFNVKNLGPLFHDASVPDVAGAVTFYASVPFNSSPAGVAIGGIALNAQEKAQLTAFLEALAPRPYTLSTRVVRFGAQDEGVGPTAAVSITITNTSASPITFAPSPCTLTGTNPDQFNITSCPLITPLAPDETRAITVNFDPSLNGVADSAILEINAPDPSGVDLFGTGGVAGAPPTVTLIAPTSGSTLGGTAITVTGANFGLGATVAIGGVDAGSVGVGPTTITASTGPHAAGLVNVVVTNPDAQAATLTNAFTYVAPPVVTSIAPEQGSFIGGTAVTITGSAFVPGVTVTIGGLAATNVVVVNATTITAVTAAHPPGPADVKVTSPGTLSDTLISGFTFVVQLPPPTISTISPTIGATFGGTPVTIFGTNFTAGASVSIGGVAAANVSVVSPTVVTATTGVHAAGAVDVVVANLDGGIATAVSRFSYQNKSPNDSFANRFPITGGGALTATGSNVGATAEVGEPNDNFPGSGATPSVWWTWTAPCSFTVDSPNAFIDTAGSSFNTVLGVFTGAGFPLTLFASDDDNGGTVTSKVPSAETSVSITAGTVFQIRVRGLNSSDTGTIVLHLTSPCAANTAPMVSSISPTTGSSAGFTTVTIAGTNFVSGATVSIGGVLSPSAFVNSATSISALTPPHVPGTFDVVVTNPDLQSGTMLNGFTVVAPPTLTALSPTAAVRATAPTVTLTGTSFMSGMTVNAGTGITVSNIVIDSPTSATATFTIAANAPLGARNVTVTTLGGTSAPVVFTLLLQAPTLTGITLNIGVPGQSVSVTLTGTSFVAGSTVDAGTGITVSNVVLNLISEASATATFTIAPGAATGARNVTVTNTAGTSNAAIFSVVDPFPDLVSGSAHTGNFGAGFNENYVLTVSNQGTAATTDTITVTDTLPAAMTFVSGSGTGWTCSGAQTVTCTRTSALAVGASTTINLVVAVASSATSGVVTNAVTVATAGDLIPANNSGTDPTTVVATPTPSFNFAGPLLPGQQSNVGVTLAAPFPHDVTGTVTMNFSSNAAIPLDDPAIQFASGGRLATFVVAANTVQAKFGSSASAGPIFFQTGTVAGTFTFLGFMQAGTAVKTFSPAPGGPNLSIPKQAPSIQKIETNTQNGFAALISLQSTLREVTQMSLTFNTTPAVKLSCGNVSGCSVSGSTITFDVKSLFDNWFTNDTTFGSLSTLRLPLTISGTVHGTVTVTLRNSMGASNTMSFSLQ